MPLRVAVIGAGPVGLMAMKNFKEDGFEVTGYEARGYVGGLWKPSEDASLSAIDTTVFNSSRYRSAISDFPFPDDTDDFPTAHQINRYLNSYCDHFGLRHHLHLSTPVKSVKRAQGRWAVEFHPKGSDPSTEYFDKVAVAAGTFVTPNKPSFEGIELFEGPDLHSIEYHEPSRFEGKNILMIGIHATSQDMAVSLSRHGANKIYGSHRSGIVMVSYLPATLIPPLTPPFSHSYLDISVTLPWIHSRRSASCSFIRSWPAGSQISSTRSSTSSSALCPRKLSQISPTSGISRPHRQRTSTLP